VHSLHALDLFKKGVKRQYPEIIHREDDPWERKTLTDNYMRNAIHVFIKQSLKIKMLPFRQMINNCFVETNNIKSFTTTPKDPTAQMERVFILPGKKIR
jgi:hypothetical protein